MLDVGVKTEQNQGQIKGGGATGAIALGPPLQDGPQCWHLIVLNKNTRLQKYRDSKEIQEYNSIFRCCFEQHNNFSASLTFRQF